MVLYKLKLTKCSTDDNSRRFHGIWTVLGIDQLIFGTGRIGFLWFWLVKAVISRALVSCMYFMIFEYPYAIVNF